MLCMFFFRIVKLDYVIRLICYRFYFFIMIRCSYIGNIKNLRYDVIVSRRFNVCGISLGFNKIIVS